MDWLGNAIILVIILVAIVLALSAYYAWSPVRYIERLGAAEHTQTPPADFFEEGNVGPVDVTDYF